MRNPNQRGQYSGAAGGHDRNAAARLRARPWAISLAVLTAVASGGSFAPAATYYWDPAHTNADPGSGGSATWMTGSTFWKIQNASGNVAWAAGNTADFSGTAGTVTLGNTFTIGGLVFDVGGYTLASNSGFVSLGAGGLVTNSTTGTTTITATLANTTSQNWSVAAGGTLQYDANFNSSSATYTFQLNSAGTTNITGTFSAIGKSTLGGSGAGGTINLSGNETFGSSDSTAYVGIDNVTVNHTAGTAMLGAGPSNSFYIGNSGTVGADSFLNITGGTVTLTTASRIYIGSGNTGSLTTAGSGTLTVGGGANAATFTTGTTANATPITLGNNVATGTINLLTNGTFATGRAFGVGAAGKGTINFNGGTLQATAAGLAIPNTVATTVRDGGAIIDTQSFTNTLAANLVASALPGDAGNGGLTKNGSGTLILTGTSTYAGPTTISNGTLQIGNGTAGAINGSSGVTIAGTASLSINQANGSTFSNDVANAGAVSGLSASGVANTLSGRISGTGTVGQTAAGVLVLSNTSNNYTGATSVVSGTLSASSLAALGSTSGVSLGSAAVGGTLQYTGGSATLSKPISLAGTGGTVALDASGSGALTVNGTILQTAAGDKTLTLAGSSTAINTLSSTLATNSNGLTGKLAVAKSGQGTWLINTANTYTGGTTLSAGTLIAGNASAFGSSGNIVMSGGTLQYGNGITTDFSNRFGSTASQAFNIDTNGNDVVFASVLAPSSGGTLTKLGAGTLSLTNTTLTSVFTGTTTISGGTLQIGNNTSTGMVGGGAIVNNAALRFNRSNSLTFNNAVSGSGSITQAGTGQVTFGGIISTNGGLTISGSSILQAANTYTGVTTVNATLEAKSSNTAFGASGPANGTTINGGGTVRVRDSTLSIAEAFTLNGGSFISYNNAGTTTFSGAFTLNTSSLIQISPQTQISTVTAFSGAFGEGATASDLTFVRNGAAGTASADVVQVTAANTYGGNTYISDALSTNTGVFSVQLSGGNDRLPTTTIVNLGGTNSGNGASDGSARLVLGDAATGAISQTLGGLTTTGTGTKNAIVGGHASNSTLTLNVAANAPAGSGTFAGKVGGGGTNENNIALVKSGNGTVELSGANTYTGGTTVSAGTLRANGSGSLGSGATNVNGGVLAGVGSTGGAVNVNGGGTITAGSGAALPISQPGLTADTTIGTLTTAAEAWAPGGAYRVKFAASGAAGTGNDLLSMTTLNLAGLANTNSGTKFTIVLLNTALNAFKTAGGTYTLASTSGAVTVPALHSTTNLTDLFNFDVSYIGLPSDRGLSVTLASNGSSGFNVNLNYEGLPEPTTAALFALGGSVLLGRRRGGRAAKQNAGRISLS